MNVYILFTLGYEPFCCVEDEYTYYLRLYILGGYEHFYCVEDENTYYLCLDILGESEHFLCCVEDEYTYYLRLYILGYEHFVVWKMNTHIIYIYIL